MAALFRFGFYHCFIPANCNERGNLRRKLKRRKLAAKVSLTSRWKDASLSEPTNPASLGEAAAVIRC